MIIDPTTRHSLHRLPEPHRPKRPMDRLKLPCSSLTILPPREIPTGRPHLQRTANRNVESSEIPTLTRTTVVPLSRLPSLNALPIPILSHNRQHPSLPHLLRRPHVYHEPDHQRRLYTVSTASLTSKREEAEGGAIPKARMRKRRRSGSRSTMMSLWEV